MKILLATDDSESARAAIDYLATFPLPSGTEVVLMTVIDKELYSNGKNDEFSEAQQQILAKTKQMMQEDAENLLADEAARLESREFLLSRLVRFGHPAREIVRAAKKHKVDLVIVGSHGFGGVKRFLLGSVSDQVLQYAHCSVLIVRALAGQVTEEAGGEAPVPATTLRILLAYDDSDHARQAAAFCAALPLPDDAQLTALTVLPLVTLYRQDIQQQLGWLWQEKKKLAEKGLAWVTEAYEWSMPKVTTQLKESADVSQAILDTAKETDSNLIVVGHKGKGAIKKFLLGSVTTRIAQQADCSVLAVRG